MELIHINSVSLPHSSNSDFEQIWRQGPYIALINKRKSILFVSTKWWKILCWFLLSRRRERRANEPELTQNRVPAELWNN